MSRRNIRNTPNAQTNTNNPVEITSLSNLQSRINELHNVRNRTAGSGQTSGENAPVEPNVQSLQELSAQVVESINSRINFIDMPPLYKKPAYYLDKLVPFIKVSVFIVMRTDADARRRGSYGTSSSEREFTPYKFLLFTEEEYESNNHLASFKYEVQPRGNANVELTIIDVKQEIIDVLTLQLAKQGVVSLDIEYGWKVEPSVASHKDLKNVYFTNTCSVVLSDIKPTYDDKGVPTLTLYGFADLTLPGELRWSTPYSVFGKFPVMALAIKEIMHAFDKKLTYAVSTNGDIRNKTLKFYRLAQVFLNAKGIADKRAVKKIILSYLKYQHFIQNIDNTEHERNEEQVFGKSNARIERQMITEINGISETTLELQAAEALNTNVMNSLDINIKRINYLGQDDIIRRRIEDPQLRWNVEIKKMLVFERRVERFYQRFTDFYVECALACGENYRVHPYYLLQYVSNVLKTTLGDQLEETELIPLQLISIDAAEDDKGSNIMPIHQEGTATNSPRIKDKFLNQRYDFVPKSGTDENEQYWRLISDYVCEPQTSWGNFLNTIVNSLKVKLDQQMSLQQARLYGVEQSQLERVSEGLYRVPPLSMSCNFFTVTGKENLTKNLETFTAILNSRKEYLQRQNSSNSNNIFSGMINSIDQTLNKLRSIGDKKYYMVMFLDILPSDSILSATSGLTNLIQAYSYRIGGIQDGLFNPGWPTASHVNFPDVLSFSPEFDYWQAMQSLISNSSWDSSSTVDGMDIVRDNSALEDEYKNNANARLRQCNRFLNSNGSPLSNAEKQNLDDHIAALTQIYDEWSQMQGVEVSGLYAEDEPLSFMIAQNYTNSRMFSGELNGTIDRQRTVQELRRRLLTSARTIKATMGVIGDPSYQQANMGRYVFLKFINQDNSLSYFTGVYLINNVTHEIKSGEFRTTLDLMFASELNDESSMRQLHRLSYGIDRQIVRLE